MSSLSQRIKLDLEQAIRDRDNLKSTVLRSAMAAIRNAEIAQQKILDDSGIIAVLEKEAKMRRESIEAFEKGNRKDLVAKEKAELDIILGYLPEPVSRDEIIKLARQVIEELGAKGPKDKGKVMSQLMPQLKGRAQGQEISTIVSE
ncbi:MAG: GatB/YqeY domain-containing protein, partial [Candidatus Bathyarchaeota archaeon]|nr:GatB/YqeY domain-containing protein [Candidatus Bathyarchaeota archaeon]